MVGLAKQSGKLWHHEDDASPIGAIKNLIESLFSRIVQYVLANDWNDDSGFAKLSKDYEQRILDLKNFVLQLSVNEFGFPNEQIDDLKQQARISTNRLKEIHFYLEQLQADPESASKLIKLRNKVFSSQNTNRNQDEKIKMIIGKLSNPLLHQWLSRQFKDPDWYGWCFEPEEIEKSVEAVNEYLKYYKSSINYDDFIQALLDKSKFIPFTLEAFQLLKPKKDYSDYPDTLRKIREDFKTYTQTVMTVNNALNAMQSQQTPLTLQNVKSLKTILEEYQTTVFPRIMQLREIHNQVKSLKQLQLQLKEIRMLLNESLESDELRLELSSVCETKELTEESVKLREDLIKSLNKLELAISRLLTQSDELRVSLSKDFSAKVSSGDSGISQNESEIAFFDPKKDQMLNPSGQTKTLSSNQTRMNALLSASRRMNETLKTH